MTDPKDTIVVPNTFHGEGDADNGVVTQSVVTDDEAEDIEQSEDDEVAQIEGNGGIEPGP